MPIATVSVATMKTARVPGPGAEFQIVEREIPAPGPDRCAEFRVVLTM